MIESTITKEQRAQTLKLMFGKVADYSRKDRKFIHEGKLNEVIWYVLGSPPYDKKAEKYGFGKYFKQRLLLFSDFLVFLTAWDPESQLDGKDKRKGFGKYMVGALLSDATLGISDMLGGLSRDIKQGKGLALLGKDAEEMLVNPWSLIIPTEDIVSFNYVKTSFTLHYLYLHVNHRFEGQMNLGITYHSGGVHHRATRLYKKMKKIL